MTIAEPPLTALEVADFLRIHVNSVKRLPPSELPFFRVGFLGARRYLPADLRAHVERRMVR